MAIGPFDAVADAGGIVDTALVDGVEAEQAAGGQGRPDLRQARLEACKATAVVQGVEKAGDQVDRLLQLEGAHVLAGEFGLGATQRGLGQHRRIEVQPAALEAGIEKVPHMGTGAAGEVEMTAATVAEQSLQAQHRLALGPVVDVGAEQVVVGRQVGVEGGGGHRQGLGAGDAGAHLSRFLHASTPYTGGFPESPLT